MAVITLPRTLSARPAVGRRSVVVCRAQLTCRPTVGIATALAAALLASPALALSDEVVAAVEAAEHGEVAEYYTSLVENRTGRPLPEVEVPVAPAVEVAPIVALETPQQPQQLTRQELLASLRAAAEEEAGAVQNKAKGTPAAPSPAILAGVALLAALGLGGAALQSQQSPPASAAIPTAPSAEAAAAAPPPPTPAAATDGSAGPTAAA